ncbi:hypothetical protein ACJJTC_009268 [Scirpophaga incertulas]
MPPPKASAIPPNISRRNTENPTDEEGRSDPVGPTELTSLSLDRTSSSVREHVVEDGGESPAPLYCGPTGGIRILEDVQIVPPRTTTDPPPNASPAKDANPDSDPKKPPPSPSPRAPQAAHVRVRPETPHANARPLAPPTQARSVAAPRPSLRPLARSQPHARPEAAPPSQARPVAAPPPRARPVAAQVPRVASRDSTGTSAPRESGDTSSETAKATIKKPTVGAFGEIRTARRTLPPSEADPASSLGPPLDEPRALVQTPIPGYGPSAPDSLHQQHSTGDTQDAKASPRRAPRSKRGRRGKGKGRKTGSAAPDNVATTTTTSKVVETRPKEEAPPRKQKVREEIEARAAPRFSCPPRQPARTRRATARPQVQNKYTYTD